MKKLNLKVLLFSLVLLFVPILLNAEITVKVDGDVTGVTKYIWRGMEINKDFVIQPSLTASVNNFSFNVWGNMDTTDYGERAGYGDQKGEFTEIDLALTYSHNFKLFSAEGGIINYTFPNNVGESTYELYLSMTLDTLLSPTLSLYYDIDEVNGFYGNFGISHTFKISRKVSLEILSSIGYGGSNFNKGYFGKDSPGFVDFNIGTAIPIKLNNNFSIAPFFNYSTIIDNDLRNADAYENNDNFYGGIKISFSF